MKRYFTIANFFLITVAGYFTVSGFYSITAAKLDSVNMAQVTTTYSSTPDVEKPIPASIVKSITDRNIFNTSKEAAETKVPVDHEGIPPTELKLKLWGTVSGGGKDTYAVIEDTKDRKQNLYKEGDPIQWIQKLYA